MPAPMMTTLGGKAGRTGDDGAAGAPSREREDYSGKSTSVQAVSCMKSMLTGPADEMNRRQA